MRKLKILGAAIIVVAALSAIASATASATMPEFLPGNEGETFKGTSGSGTLSSSAGEIICTEDSVTGENIGTTKKEALAEVTFKGCKALTFFGAHSLSDPEGTIKTHLELKLCYINKTNKEVGVLSKVLPVHIEVAGKLLEVEGDQVAKITPVNSKTATYKLAYTESKNKPTPEGCEGEKEHFTTSVNEGTAAESGETTTETTTYAAEQTLDA